MADSTAARREIRGWSALAMLSLAVAGGFALLLALSRVPGAAQLFPWPVGFFQKGLVIHVVLSFVVWLLSVLGVTTTLATLRLSAGRPRWRWLGAVAIVGTAVATVMLFVPAWFDRGEPSLNNYVPVIIDPLYYGGLAVLAGSVALTVIRLFANLPGRRGPLEPVSLSAGAAGLVYLLALACFTLAWLKLAAGDGAPVTVAFNEDLFWGGGHALQFVNLGLMLGAWYVLGGLALGRPMLHPRLMTAALVLLVLAALPAPFLYVFLEPFSGEHKQAFTDLQFLLAPPVLLVTAGAAATLWRAAAKRLPWTEPVFHCLVLSMVVFAVGGVLGLFVDGADTRTPAHYHGVIGGINLALMGLFFGLILPLLDRALAAGKVLMWSIWLYGAGQLSHALGLFWAGGYGAPRKTVAAEGLEGLAATAGLYLLGVGAAIAVVGGVMFIVLVSKALLKRL
ncbi:MAG: cbb3-type cytochrome c oxidase subunit I [Rhodospirillales bacterium]|nr:cbb3-type cytochrome c oxidase subunit I [Rhodospirillales bacterium]